MILVSVAVTESGTLLALHEGASPHGAYWSISEFAPEGEPGCFHCEGFASFACASEAWSERSGEEVAR